MSHHQIIEPGSHLIFVPCVHALQAIYQAIIHAYLRAITKPNGCETTRCVTLFIIGLKTYNPFMCLSSLIDVHRLAHKYWYRLLHSANLYRPLLLLDDFH